MESVGKMWSERSVNLESSELNGYKKGWTRIAAIHNHPNGTPFSYGPDLLYGTYHDKDLGIGAQKNLVLYLVRTGKSLTYKFEPNKFKSLLPAEYHPKPGFGWNFNDKSIYSRVFEEYARKSVGWIPFE
jgi:hypothetical protein